MRLILLNPGPVTLSERVRAAMLRPDLCHREPEFAALQSRIRAGLLAVYDLDPREWAAVLLTCSGTGAVEAMLSSLVPAGQSIVTIENGVYGERLSTIAAAHAIPYRKLTHAWGESIRVRDLAGMLDRDTRQVAVIHHETTTGRLNRLDALASATAAQSNAEAAGARLLVDAVSSFGAEAIDFDGWRIDACAATANKCLHGVPGVSFVIVRRSRLVAAVRRSVYLDLESYCAAQDAGTTPFTQAVQACYALDEALAEFHDAGGLNTRNAQYRRLSAMVRDGLAALGIEALHAAADTSCVLSAFRLPRGVSYASLHDGLKGHGFIIYAGPGDLSKSIFRVAIMGAIDDADIDRFLATTNAVVADIKGG